MRESKGKGFIATIASEEHVIKSSQTMSLHLNSILGGGIAIRNYTDLRHRLCSHNNCKLIVCDDFATSTIN